MIDRIEIIINALDSMSTALSNSIDSFYCSYQTPTQCIIPMVTQSFAHEKHSNPLAVQNMFMNAIARPRLRYPIDLSLFIMIFMIW